MGLLPMVIAHEGTFPDGLAVAIIVDHFEPSCWPLSLFPICL